MPNITLSCVPVKIFITDVKIIKGMECQEWCVYEREGESLLRLLFINSLYTFHICLTENDGVWGHFVVGNDEEGVLGL